MNEVTSKKILVVEDKAIIGMEIKNRLEKNGFNVVGLAKTGGSAIAMAAEREPDLVLMDISLKGEMDGIQATEQIVSNQGLPIVFLTANADRATLDRAKMTGPFGYLIKPFQEKELMTTIEIALYKHQMEADLRQAKETAEHALAEVKRLQGVLPICSYCKQIRDEKDAWHQLEQYITEHSEAKFTHGICPSCYAEQFPHLDAPD